MHKIFYQGLILFVVIIVLVACNNEGNKASGSASSVNSDKEIVVSIANLGSSSTLSVAKELGYLQEELAEHNAKLEYSIHAAGPPINEGIASKRIDLAILGEGAILGGANNNLDTKLISLASDGLTGVNSIIAHKDSGIKTVKDLKGKKIGVGLGTSHHVFLLKVLNENGLSIDDVNLVNLTLTDAHPAFQTGQIDAWVTADLYANIEAANGAVLITNGKEQKLYSPTFYIARGEFAKQHPEIVEAFLRAIDRAIALSETDYEQYITLAAKAVNQDVELVRAAHNSEIINKAPSEELIEQFQQSTVILKELGYVTNDIDIKSLIDLSFIEKVKAK